MWSGISIWRMRNRVDSLGRQPEDRIPIRLDQVDDGLAWSFAPIIAVIERLLRCVHMFEIIIGTDKKIAIGIIERRTVRDDFHAPRVEERNALADDQLVKTFATARLQLV